MARLLGIGLLAALFFSSTFVLNRVMDRGGGHWYWSAALRYGYTLLFVAGGFVLSGRAALVGRVWRAYLAHWPFWTLTGGVGFWLFYTGIAIASPWAPSWVLATTWQLTILATPLVLLGFGRRVPLRGVLFALLIFTGVVLVNVEHMGTEGGHGYALLMAVAPLVVAAFAYPTGLQLVWEARRRSMPGGVPARFAWIPASDTAVLEHPFARLLLLVVGSVPWWVGLWAVTRPPAPAPNQWVNAALVALLSGIVATVLFMQARHLAHSAYQLAAVDSTQAAEVLFSLVGEMLLLGGLWPGRLGIAGITLTIVGLVLYLLAQGTGAVAARPVDTAPVLRGHVDLRWYALVDERR